MWSETTRVETRGETTRGETTRGGGETSRGRNVSLPYTDVNLVLLSVIGQTIQLIREAKYID